MSAHPGILEKAVAGFFSEWLRPVRHADVVVQLKPDWVSAKTARALCGVNRDKLDGWVAARRVVAKRCGGNILYRYADIGRAIEALPDR